MDLKDLLSVFGTFTSELKDSTHNLVKTTIRTETSTIGFKFLMGVVIAAAMIFSIIQFGFAYNIWLSQFHDEINLKLLSFGFVIIAGAIALYFLFKKEKIEVKAEVPSSTIDLPNIALSFAAGIMEGLQSTKRDHKDL